MERLTYRVSEAAAVLGVSRSLLYRLVRCGAIPALKLGTRIVIPRAAVERVLKEAS